MLSSKLAMHWKTLNLGLRLFALGILAVLSLTARATAGERVAVVVGESPAPLEQYAADELCAYLKKLFGVDVQPNSSAPPSSTEVILIGTPTSNKSIAAALATEKWPTLGDQAILLKRVQFDGKPALIVGGGSPRATLWSAYELVERWGVHFLLQGDVLPDDIREFYLPEVDEVIEPIFPVRQWRVVNCFGCGPESWGLADYRPVIDQLAKMKFNRIFAAIYPWQPYLDLEHNGIRRQRAWLWWNLHLPITADMPGRQLFNMEPEWWNPDLPYKSDYQSFAAAARNHLRGLMDYAKCRGLDIGMNVNLAEFPREFAPLLKDHRVIYESLGNLTITPGPDQPADDPSLCDLSEAVIKQTLDTYPDVDFIVPEVPEIPAWSDAYQKAWAQLDAKYNLESRLPLATILENASQRRGYAGGGERAQVEVKSTIATLSLTDTLLADRRVLSKTKRPDAFVMFCSTAEELLPVLPYLLPAGSETLNQFDYTPDRIVARREALAQAGTGMRHNLIFTLHDDNVGLLPMSNMSSLAILSDEMQKQGWAGFSTRYWLISDHEDCVTYLARRAWDDKTNVDEAYQDRCAAICGDSAAPHLAEMMHELQILTSELNQHGLGFTFPVSRGMIMRHMVPEPLPERMVKWRESYQRALAAAIRAEGVASNRGKPYVAYWVGRLRFGIGFFDCVEQTHDLARARLELAKAEKENDPSQIAVKRAAVLACAEAAVKTSREMIESFASVARNRSDRGAVAALAEYVYRPLQEELQSCQK